MKFDKTQKRALVFVAGLLGLSWYMGGQFEKADMMRSEGKRPCCSKPSMFFTMRGLSCYNCSKEDRIYRPAKEDSFNQMRSEADAYAYAYNEGHSDNRKDEDYQPVLSSGREEGRFRKILKQRAETFNAELEEEEFGEYFLDMDVYDDILSYALTGGNEFFLKGEEGGDYVEIFINDESVGETYVWWDKDMEQEVGGDCRYIIINNEMFHLNDLKEIDLGAETFNAEDEKRINGMTLDDWLDELDRIKATKEPFYYSNNILGSPKYGNMIDMFWEQGWTPQGILDAWESYDRQEGHWEKIRAETFNAQTTKKPKLTKTQLAALNMMKASTFYGSGGYAYVEVDNRGWKSYTTRPVQGLLDKGIITIPKDENRRFYGRVKSMEAYIVYLNPVAWEYPFRYDYDKSLSQVGNKIVQNKKIQQQEHSRILKQKQDEENMTLEEVLDELFGAEALARDWKWKGVGWTPEEEATLSREEKEAVAEQLYNDWRAGKIEATDVDEYYERLENNAESEEIKITDIDWETDGEDVELPSSVMVPSDLEEDEIADYLSDNYGWLVNGFIMGAAENFDAEYDFQNVAITTVEADDEMDAWENFGMYGVEEDWAIVDVREAETMTPNEVKVKVTKDVTPKGSKIIVEECVDIQAHKADATANFYRVRFRDPAEMSNFRVPAWAARAANTMGSKYYDVAGSKVTMGQDKSGNWKIQSVMVPKRANVDVDLALKIANHIQDRLEKEGKWAPKKCQDNERVLVIR